MRAVFSAPPLRSPALRGPLRRLGQVLVRILLVAIVVSPLAIEQAIERVRFDDRLGTLPVAVELCRRGSSSLDTGILGTIYWERTGTAGLGACLRVTGPPVADGTLASYVDPAFVRANAEVISAPEDLVAAYTAEIKREFLSLWWRIQVLLTALGMALLALVLWRVPGRPMAGPDRSRLRIRSAPAAARIRERQARLRSRWQGLVARRPRTARAVQAGAITLAATMLSAFAASGAWSAWSESDDLGPRYPLDAIPGLSFSSPQAQEIAAQVQPFLTKNQQRMRDRADEFVALASDSMRAAVRKASAIRPEPLAPRDGEIVVLAEADPQGSQVGTRVRRAIYPLLQEAIGPSGIALRAIAGDITSNGAVAEEGFVRREVQALPGVTTAAVTGDHDSATTSRQLEQAGVAVLDNRPRTLAGLRVAGAADPEYKTLFGGMVTNPSGVSEAATGRRLRGIIDESPTESALVLLHQPKAVAGYLGLPDLRGLPKAGVSLTTPQEDGIADLPPGVITIGHLHRYGGPQVLWNTDTERVTWTVVLQLGTSGGAEPAPTINRFSTPFSVPLRPVTMVLQYLDAESGLLRGIRPIRISVEGEADLGSRIEIGTRTLPGTPVGPIAQPRSAATSGEE